ncbi:MAG: putative glycoside hydrolase [Desulfuromusa sp.]|nr:putative glycoside hydrolase [Desulfuromusa sp.]
MKVKLRHWTLIVTLLFCMPGHAAAELETIFGTVRDAQSGALLNGVELRTADDAAFSDVDGRFQLESNATEMVVRLPGYLPQKVPVDFPLHLNLQSFTPKALYLSYWAADSRDRRDQLQQLIAETRMNALVIDLKSSRGDIAFRSQLPLAQAVGAQKVRTLKDLPEFLAELKRQGIYTIGRIVVFKDAALARNRRDLAVHTLDGYLWEDREKISWTDPFNPKVWDYNISIAKEAAALGFDEIQFDYIRFPAKSDLMFSQENNGDNRVAAINGFLQLAKQQLANYPVMTSANIFGYICWKHKDQKIGQRLIDLAEHVDYLSPMLYPSGFPHGVPGYKNPVEHSYEVIAQSLQKAAELTGLPAVRFRPWLQAFRDYAFDRRNFTAEEIHAQINASDASGSHGWMLWNAASRFSLAGLQQEIPLGELNLVDASPKAGDFTILTRAADQNYDYFPMM